MVVNDGLVLAYHITTGTLTNHVLCTTKPLENKVSTFYGFHSGKHMTMKYTIYNMQFKLQTKYTRSPSIHSTSDL